MLTEGESRMSAKLDNVVLLDKYREPPVQSQYEQYHLPFFAAEDHSTWSVKPTGDYFEDRQTGKRFAIEFLRSCDGTNGWVTLLPQIVGDMIIAGPSGTFADGWPKVNGIVVGFVGTISKVLTRTLLA